MTTPASPSEVKSPLLEPGMRMSIDQSSPAMIMNESPAASTPWVSKTESETAPSMATEASVSPPPQAQNESAAQAKSTCRMRPPQVSPTLALAGPWLQQLTTTPSP